MRAQTRSPIRSCPKCVAMNSAALLPYSVALQTAPHRAARAHPKEPRGPEADLTQARLQHRLARMPRRLGFPHRGYSRRHRCEWRRSSERQWLLSNRAGDAAHAQVPSQYFRMRATTANQQDEPLMPFTSSRTTAGAAWRSMVDSSRSGSRRLEPHIQELRLPPRKGRKLRAMLRQFAHRRLCHSARTSRSHAPMLPDLRQLLAAPRAIRREHQAASAVSWTGEHWV